MQNHTTMKTILANRMKEGVNDWLSTGKRLIPILFLLLFGVGQMWAKTYSAGDVLFYDFSAVTGGGGTNWHTGTDMMYDDAGAGSVKCVIFTSSVSISTSWVMAKTAKGSWAEMKFTEPSSGQNCIKVNSDGKTYSWTTRSLAEDIASGNYIMVYGGELSSWNQSSYRFMSASNTDKSKVVANANLSVTINSDAYKFGPVAIASGTYYQGHWASGLSCAIAAGSAYVVRGSGASATYFTQKANSGSDYLYQVIKPNATAPTTSLTPTCPSSIDAGTQLSFSHGAAGKSVLGYSNTVKYYLKSGSTYTEKTLSDGKIDVSDLAEGDYSIITLLYDGYIYVKASKSDFSVVTPTTFSVTYNANYPASATSTSGSVPSDATAYADGATVTVKGNTGSLAAGGYTFAGWNTQPDGQGTDRAASSTFSITANTQLYAKWTENITTVTINVSPASKGTLTVGGAAFTPGNTTTAGVATSRTVVATAANDYAFSSWSVTGNATGTSSTNTYTLKGNGSGSTGTLTANFTLVPCSLMYGNSTPLNSPSSTAMSYDATEHAYYKEITTTSSPFYFRFSHGDGKQYSGDWNTYPDVNEVTANGSKFTCSTETQGWGNKASVKYIGESGTTIRIWFDYQNKKTWITADKDKQYVLRGATAADSSVPGGMPGWGATTSYFDGLASGTSGTYEATLNAGTWYHLKVYDMYNKTWYGNTTGDDAVELIDGTLSTMGSKGNFYFGTTIDGNYTFTLDKSSGTKIKVDYPVSYQVQLEVGTVKGNNQTPGIYLGSYDPANKIESGSYVPAGSHVIFVVASSLESAAKTGYTWCGFFDNAAGSTPTQYTNNEVTTYHIYSIAADAHVYACFYENDYTVTVNAGTGGKVNSLSSTTITGHKDTKANLPIATADPGYYFVNWTTTTGTLYNSTNASTGKINGLTSTATVTANFAPIWTIAGLGGDWNTNKLPLTSTYVESTVNYAYLDIDTLRPNTTYYFKAIQRSQGDPVWWRAENASDKEIKYTNSNTRLNMVNTTGDNFTLKTAGAGRYTFDVNLDNSKHPIKVHYPTSYTVTFGSAHGTVTATVEDATVITTGQYAAEGKDITFTQLPATGYMFKGWYNAESGGSAISCMSSDNVYDDIAANISVYAQYNAKTYNVTLDQQTSAAGYGSSGDGSLTATYDAAFPSATMPTAAQGYAFMGYWSGEGGTGTQFTNASGVLLANIENYSDASGNWKYDASDLTLYAYFKKGAISALTLDAAIVAPGTTMGVTPTLDPIPVGDKVICWRVLHGNGNPLDDQPAFSWDGTKVTFPASTNSGTYLAEAILRKGTTCGGEVLDSVTVAFQVAGDHVVTVQYKCGDEFIQTSTTATGRPLAWSEDITAPTIFGYTFARWDAGDGVTIKDGSGEDKTTSTSSTIKIKATYEGKLTAIYTQKQLIYFKNTLGWSDVYVNFYSSEYSWNSTKGSGNQNVTNRNKAMTRIGDTDIWYYDYGYNGGGSSITPSLFVSFTSNSQSNAVNFWLANPGVNVVYPTRYMDALTTDKSSEAGFKAATPMFVPLAGQTATVLNNADNGKANYYNRGYWTKYTPGTGYTLEIYNSAGDVLLKSMEFTSNDELMPMDATVDLEANQTYKFQLRRGGESSAGVYYGNSGTMTYQDHGQGTAWEMTNHPSFSMAGITSSAAGSYTFHLTYSASASGAYRLRMAVDYPVTKGDYRLLYKDNVQTKWFKSAIVPKAENESKVSFFVRKGQSAVLKLQKCTNIANDGTMTWTDTVANLFSGGLPSAITKDSVYVFTFNKAANGKLQLASTAVYDGEYYIRTDCANSKWDNYRSDPDHRMTYSEYSITHGGYSHYYCHWVQTDDRKNVKFCIANDYSPSISDTLTRETASGEWANINSFIDEHGNILRNANVRFMWNQHDNTIKRAYIDGAQGSGSDNYLKMLSSDSKIKDLDGNIKTEVYFQDNENWIYETNIQAKPDAQYKLTSNWGTGTVITQYFKGTSSSTETLITGSGENWYVIRVLYDFKTNRLIAAMLPSGEVDEEREINADVMFIREHQGDIEQLILADDGKISKIETAYGVMRFNKWTINNKDKSTHLPLDAPASIYERSLYWVSFPFRVKLSEVFGFGTYGTHWILQYYDGAARAQYGMWAETGTYWKFIWDRKDFILEPNVGYLLTLETELMGEGSDIWGPNSRSSQVELYFPSYDDMPDITQADVVHNLPSHQCEIDRTSEGLPGGNDYRTTYDRRIVDSHWNVLSVPTYVNTDDVTFASSAWTSTRPKFLYTWNADDNTITATSATGFTFHAMHAYMVQFYGNVTWSAHSGSPYPIVARSTYSEAPKEVEFCLELQQNEKMIDRTYINLSDDETVSAGFAFNEDMTKEFSGNKASIYTFIDGDVVAAGNTLPMSEMTTIVPVGVETKKAGDYTISIPEGTQGIGITLVDEETGVRTNLSALDYTINLPAGTHDNRFYLEISPIKTTPTGLEPTSDSSLKGREVRKVLIDQQMYIIKDGKMYDARGNLCK